MSGVGGPTERVSSFLDFYFQPEAQRIPSYTKDSSSIIALCENTTLDQDVILVTIDVQSLYLNIPHQEGIDSALQHLFGQKEEREDIPFPKDFARALCRIVLEHNIFEFNGRMYKQVRGTAMGTRMAPAYANLFLDSLERKLLTNQPLQPIVWRRYIDDILCIWHGTTESLDSFLMQLNGVHPTIKFTWEISESRVIFLDLEIFKGNRFRTTGKLDTRLHFKETNKFQYLPFNSAHPRPVMKGLVKGEITRALRASSDDLAFETTKAKIVRHLQQRGYPRKLLHDIAKTIAFTNRTKLLEETPDQPTSQPPAFVCIFHEQISHRALNLALEPPNPADRPRISYRKKTDISKKIVRARLPESSKPTKRELLIQLASRLSLSGRHSSIPCRRTNCLCCQQMSGLETVFSSRGHASHRVPPNTSCNTSGVIYMLHCNICLSRAQYIGQTKRPLRERVAGHRAAFEKKKNMPLYRHLSMLDHSFSNAKFTIIEVVANSEDLVDREKYWIKTLNTVIPMGLNSKWSLLGYKED